VLTPGGPVGLRMVRPEPRKMSKREMGRVGEFEPAIVAPRDRALGITIVRQVCADGAEGRKTKLRGSQDEKEMRL
jgi:hypothetical protein